MWRVIRIPSRNAKPLIRRQFCCFPHAPSHSGSLHFLESTNPPRCQPPLKEGIRHDPHIVVENNNQLAQLQSQHIFIWCSCCVFTSMTVHLIQMHVMTSFCSFATDTLWPYFLLFLRVPARSAVAEEELCAAWIEMRSDKLLGYKFTLYTHKPLLLMSWET